MMSSKILKATPLLGALALGALAPSLASAQQTQTIQGPVFVTLDEFRGSPTTGPFPAEATLAGTASTKDYVLPGSTGPGTLFLGDGVTPTPTGMSYVANQEVVGTQPTGQLGAIDMHFEYLTSTAIAPGTALTANYNIIEPSFGDHPGQLSDTLSITFTGHTPGGGDNNNLSVDLHFRSDNEGGVTLPPLAAPPAGAGFLQTITDPYDGRFTILTPFTAASGLPLDFNIQYRSDVPEIDPGSAVSALACLSGGVTMMVGRRRKAAKA